MNWLCFFGGLISGALIAILYLRAQIRKRAKYYDAAGYCTCHKGRRDSHM